MTPGPWRLAPLATLACLAVTVPRTASSQVGATTDIIVGTVTGPDSQPLAGAAVEITSRETQGSRRVTTDARGRFTLLFPDGGGRYELVVRYIAMAPAHLAVARQGDEDRIVANVQMGLAPVPLEAVTVTAQRSGRSDRVGRGATGQGLSGEEVARLPTDASDLNTVATLAPGVIAIGGGDTSSANFSVAGQRPTANNVTLDGMSLGSGEVPQDAVRAIRVVTNSYDVARGQFSGGLVASTTRSGTNTPQGSFTTTLRDRTVAWGDAMSTPFGQGMTQTQLGGGVGGPIVPNRLFVFAALQGRWRTQALPSLTSADDATLDRLGVDPDSASRFRALAGATGTPAVVPGRSDERAGYNTLGLLRLDWQASPVQTVTLRLDGHWISQEPTHVGTLALPATGARRSQRSGGVMASLTSYLGGNFVNEARGYVAADRKDVRALLALPAARVEVASPLAGGGQDVATLTFGGNGAAPQRTNDRTIELADELSWLSRDTKHRVKLGSYLNRTRVDDDQTPNQLGTFTFPSLAALSADNPSTFTRTLGPAGRGRNDLERRAVRRRHLARRSRTARDVRCPHRDRRVRRRAPREPGGGLALWPADRSTAARAARLAANRLHLGIGGRGGGGPARDLLARRARRLPQPRARRPVQRGAPRARDDHRGDAARVRGSGCPHPRLVRLRGESGGDSVTLRGFDGRRDHHAPARRHHVRSPVYRAPRMAGVARRDAAGR